MADGVQHFAADRGHPPAGGPLHPSRARLVHPGEERGGGAHHTVQHPGERPRGVVHAPGWIGVLPREVRRDMRRQDGTTRKGDRRLLHRPLPALLPAEKRQESRGL